MKQVAFLRVACEREFVLNKKQKKKKTCDNCSTKKINLFFKKWFLEKHMFHKKIKRLVAVAVVTYRNQKQV